MSMNDTQFGNDQYDYIPSDYVGQNDEEVPTPAHYRFKVAKAERKKDFTTGEEVSVDGWPVITLQRVEILEPEQEAGTFTLFQDISTKPFPRGKRQVMVSRAQDLLRAIDVDAVNEAGSFSEVVLELERRIAEGSAVFTAFSSLKGYDKAKADALKPAIQQAQANGDTDAVRKLYREAQLNGKDFKNLDGSFRLVTPSKIAGGAPVKAKLVLSSFLASDENDVELGPQA